MHTLGLLHALAHGLRYAAVEAQPGQRVTIEGFRSLEPLGRRIFATPAARLIWPNSRPAFRAVLRQRIGAELLFELPPASLPAPAPRANLRMLQELGLIGADAGADAGADEIDVELLTALLDAVRAVEDRAFGLLDLWPAERGTPSGHEFVSLPGYFPREFELSRACVTNYPNLWIMKNVHLHLQRQAWERHPWLSRLLLR